MQEQTWTNLDYLERGHLLFGENGNDNFDFTWNGDTPRSLSAEFLQAKLLEIQRQNQELHAMLANVNRLSYDQKSIDFVRNKLEEIKRQNQDIRDTLTSMDEESVEQKLRLVVQQRQELERSLFNMQ